MPIVSAIDAMTRGLSAWKSPMEAPVSDQQGARPPKKRSGRAVGFAQFDRERLSKFMAGEAASRAGRENSAATIRALIEAARILIDEHGAFDDSQTSVSMMDQDQSDIDAIRSDPANAEVWINVTIKILTAYAAHIPKAVDQASFGVTMEALGVVSGARDLIGHWALILMEKNGHASTVMKPWHRSVRDNMKAMRGARMDQRVASPGDIFPSERRSKMTSYELAHDAFRGTPLLKLLSIHLPLPVPYHVRTQHMQVVGPSGSGKSMLLKNILDGDIRSGHGVFIVDCEGDLSDALLWHCMGDRSLSDRLVYIDPADPTMRPETNILKLGKAGSSTELMAYVMSGLGEGFTGRMSGFFEKLADVLSEIDGANLDTMIDILADDAAAQLNSASLSKESREWLTQQLPSGTNVMTRDYVHGRISRLRGRNIGEVGKMFRGKETRLDLGDMLDEGKIVVVRVNGDTIDNGGLGDYAALASRFYVASYVVAGMRRPTSSKRLWLGHLDEAAEHVSGGDDKFLVRGFNRLRKRGVCLAVYHQNLRQLKGDLAEAVMGSTGIKIAGKVKPADQEKLAEHMSCSKALFGQVKKRDRQWAEMVCSVDQIADRGAICRFPLGTMERRPRISEDRHQDIMDEQRSFWRSLGGGARDIQQDDEEDEDVIIPMPRAASVANSDSPFL